jgi:hypothetical protein
VVCVESVIEDLQVVGHDERWQRAWSVARETPA